MGKRVVLGGLAGGLALYGWSVVSHLLLPLGEVGLRFVPDEEPLLAAIRSTTTQPGFYLFPGIDMRSRPGQEQQAIWAAKYAAGPTGILVYRSPAGSPMSPRQLGTELVSDFAIGLLAAALLSKLRCDFMGRLAAAGAIGIIGGLDVHVSYWAWYGFPGSYTLAVLADQLVGFLVLGMVVALIVRPGASTESLTVQPQ
jgi:hypothetical protein